MEKKQFILLENNQLLCNGIRTWLNEDHKYQVMMQTGSWEVFMNKIASRPGVHVISSFQWILKNPGLDTFNAFFLSHPRVNVVCLDDGAPTFSSLSIFNSPISGVINLTSDKDEFLWGLRHVVEGRFFISRRKPAFEPISREELS
jgi:hypothetical protein